MTRSGQTLTLTYDYLDRRIRKVVTGTDAKERKYIWDGWKLVAETLGDVVGYVDASGTVNAAYEYNGYGMLRQQTGSMAALPFGFASQYTDRETGLVYYGYRYYNATHGRFIVWSCSDLEPPEIPTLYGGVTTLPRSAATFGALLTGQVILLFPLCAIIIALAPELESALGPRWTGAAPTAQILAAACMIGVFGDAVTPLLQGRGRADRVLVVEITRVFLHGFPTLVAGGIGGVTGAAGLLLFLNASLRLQLAELLPWHVGLGPRAIGLARTHRLLT